MCASVGGEKKTKSKNDRAPDDTQPRGPERQKKNYHYYTLQ